MTHALARLPSRRYPLPRNWNAPIPLHRRDDRASKATTLPATGAAARSPRRLALPPERAFGRSGLFRLSNLEAQDEGQTLESVGEAHHARGTPRAFTLEAKRWLDGVRWVDGKACAGAVARIYPRPAIGPLFRDDLEGLVGFQKVGRGEHVRPVGYRVRDGQRGTGDRFVDGCEGRGRKVDAAEGEHAAHASMRTTQGHLRPNVTPYH